MILVTGGTGFVGSHLLYKLVSSGVPVRAMKRETSSLRVTKEIFGYYTDNPEEILKKIEWVNADFKDTGSLMNMLDEVTQIYHCAGFVSFKDEDKARVYEANLYSTKNLLDAALKKGVQKFCHLSSSSSTDKNFTRGTVTEEMVWRPYHKCTEYARSKFLAELAVFEAMTKGLRAVIVNPTNIFGPGKWDGGTSQLFQAVWKGLLFYPEGISGFVDVRDVVSSMIFLTNSKISGERFIINAENLAYKEIFNWIAGFLHVEPPRYRFNSYERELIWRGLKVYSRFSGKNPPLNKDNLKVLTCHYYFSNEKIKRATDMQFIPVQDSIWFTAKIFLERMEKEYVA